MITNEYSHNWSKDRIQVFLLSACQALMMSGTSLIMTITALTGAMLATDPGMATLPLAFQFVGMMCTTIPASLFMGKIGRKIGFSVGFAAGSLSALLAAHAVYIGDFWLFVIGSFGIGISASFAQYLRFAAAEIVDTEHRPSAISYVLAGGLVAAFLGPWLATQSKEWFDPILFVGGFVCVAVLYAIAILVVWCVRFNKSTPDSDLHGPARPLMEIARQPAFITAALAATMGYGVMSFVMTATPLAIVGCGLEFSDAAFVIQWHIVGMYLPSFFTGKLIKTFGVLKIIMAGTVLNALCMAFALSGLDLMNFWFALVALGVGWNFMFVGGSSLLTECYRETERAKVQALNDFLVFGTVALASFSSGAIQNTLGWGWVNAVIALPMLLALISVIWLNGKRKESVV